MNNERVLVIIGPSGSGKSTIISTLQDKQLISLVRSWTTRVPRPDENDGSVDHVFVSDEEFTKKAREGFFLEVATLFGLPYRYGLPRLPLSQVNEHKIVTVILRAPLLPLFSKYYHNYVTYQLEDSYERVSGRLGWREEVGEQQGDRLEGYDQEVAEGRQVADRIFVNDLTPDDVTARIERAIKKDFGTTLRR